MANILQRVGKKGVSYKVQIRLQGVAKTETFSTLVDARKWASIEAGHLQASRIPSIYPELKERHASSKTEAVFPHRHIQKGWEIARVWITY